MLNSGNIVKPSGFFCSHSTIEEIINESRKLISYYEKKFNVKDSLLRILLRLNLFKYNQNELKKDKNINFDLIQDEIKFILDKKKENISLYNEYLKMTLPFQEMSKVVKRDGCLYEATDKESKIIFKTVLKDIGFIIQEKLHYIQKARKDTLFEFGLFRKGAEIPFAYAAFSLLDREYLDEIPYIHTLKGNNILVKTRAFSFINSPKNAMSLLYSLAANYFEKNTDYNLIMTAINQNLTFDAGSFLGASYFPFANSPLIFQYIDGMYATRRDSIQRFGTDNIDILKYKSNYQIAKIQPLPIIWLLKGIDKSNRKQIEKDYKLDNIGIYEISKDSYYKH